MGEGRGNTFTMLLKERRKGDCGNAINSEYFENSGGSYTGRPSESESPWKKMIGKPYSGKPNVRFDEGELEIEHSATTPALYSTATNNQILFHNKKAVNNFNKKSRWILFTKNQIAIRAAKGNPGDSSVINFDFFFSPGDKSKRPQRIYKPHHRRQNIFFHR